MGMPEKMFNDRLFPVLPPEGLRAFCFYPMSKRRGEQNNWYSLPYEEREALMRQHGASGRDFKGRILQVVTGSTGLDDWEWGVTLLPVLDDGGSPLTAYEVSAIGVDLYAHRCVVSANETACTISGLDSGATFVISVMAANSWDNSLPASGGSIMTWRLPAAPVTVSALSQSRAATLTWSAPNNNGGNPVTSYTVTDGHAHQCVTVLTNCTMSNLVNGMAYVFTVTATTRAGTSPVATFASVIPLGTNITQRVAGFGVNSSTISRAMSDQITSVATAIVSSGRRVVTITGYGNVGLPNSIRLARANHARATLLAALAAAGHRDVVVSVAAGPASTTFGVGGPAVLAASTRCVVIATH